MQRTVIGLTLVCVMALGACASVPGAPPNAPTPLSMLDQIGDPGTPYSAVVEIVGDPTVAEGAVLPGSSLIRLAYRYRHTAILTEDVVGYSITVPGVQAPAGAPGYYAGTFVNSGPYIATGSGELWCFLPSVAGGKRDHLCLLKDRPGLAAIAPTRLNPYLWDSFAAATGTFDYVNTPIYEHRQVEIPGDLMMEYRFRGFTRNGVRVEVLAVGREVQILNLPIRDDGTAELKSVAGTYLVSKGDVAEAAVIRRK